MAHAATSPNFSVGKLLSRSWSVFIGNIGSFLILSALVYAPLLIFVVFTLGGGSSDEIVLGTTGVISGILTFLLSFVEIYGVALTSPTYASILLYGSFVAILVIRPQGLFGGPRIAR